jgi:hypothetical protein
MEYLESLVENVAKGVNRERWHRVFMFNIGILVVVSLFEIFIAQS